MFFSTTRTYGQPHRRKWTCLVTETILLFFFGKNVKRQYYCYEQLDYIYYIEYIFSWLYDGDCLEILFPSINHIGSSNMQIIWPCKQRKKDTKDYNEIFMLSFYIQRNIYIVILNYMSKLKRERERELILEQI